MNVLWIYFYEIWPGSAVFTVFFFSFFLSPMINNKHFLARLVPILPLLLADLFDSIQGKFSSKYKDF